ncbi:kinase-like protein [Rhizophagus irregularis]|uniref:Kinase-like protein n=1 Tax=Rhizophagus irregularis TaxID=588596 RepID=A0A2N0NZ00_9GLOM|nr:kinase-like protein [Rhizophagus irregularis]PKB99797.1 kinase-like protein [Rhizophagus irregularis]
MEKQHVLELFKLKGKNPQINCNFRMSDNEFPKTLDPDTLKETQLFSPYERYPEWVPYNSLSQIKKIGEGGFGTVFSAMWSWGIKSSLEEEDKDDKTRKKYIIIELVHVQAQFDFCHLYGITQDPSTLEYMFIMRFAPQGDLRRYLLRNFDNLLLPNKLGWVHGDLHSGDILLLNEENAFISDFGMCRPTDTVEAKDKVYGVISYIAPEIIRGHPYSQAGDIYSLGILLWELACGIIAFADRSHDVNLILDICDGLRPQTSHYSPIVYNDIIKMCWDPDPSKRPSASEILISIERLCEFKQSKDVNNYPLSGHSLEHGGIFFKHILEFSNSNGYGLIKYFESEIFQQLKLAHKACRIYIKMKWKPNKPIHSEAVYTSRSFSYKSLQDEIDILLVKSNRSSIVE